MALEVEVAFQPSPVEVGISVDVDVFHPPFFIFDSHELEFAVASLFGASVVMVEEIHVELEPSVEESFFGGGETIELFEV